MQERRGIAAVFTRPVARDRIEAVVPESRGKTKASIEHALDVAKVA
jgi:hypothetical protein